MGWVMTMWQYKPSLIACEEVDMQYRPVIGWGRLPETWPPREIRSLQKFEPV